MALLEPAIVVPDSQERAGAGRQFAHGLMVCDTLASVELGTRGCEHLRFITGQEILDRAPQAIKTARKPFAIPVTISHAFGPAGRIQRESFHLTPDALFGIEYAGDGQKLYRFFALEAERTNRIYCGNLRQTSWLKKALAYNEIAATKAHKSWWGLPNLLVLVVAPTASRIESMKNLTLDVTRNRGSPLFLFRDIPVLGWLNNTKPATLDIVTLPWSRVGRPDLYLNAA